MHVGRDGARARQNNRLDEPIRLDRACIDIDCRQTDREDLDTIRRDASPMMLLENVPEVVTERLGAKLSNELVLLRDGSRINRGVISFHYIIKA